MRGSTLKKLKREFAWRMGGRLPGRAEWEAAGAPMAGADPTLRQLVRSEIRLLKNMYKKAKRFS